MKDSQITKPTIRETLVVTDRKKLFYRIAGDILKTGLPPLELKIDTDELEKDITDLMNKYKLKTIKARLDNT